MAKGCLYNNLVINHLSFKSLMFNNQNNPWFGYSSGDIESPDE
jgi:hypothetical protein